MATDIPTDHASRLEMLNSIERTRGLNLELSRSVPFYAFICVDLVTSMSGQATDRRELVCTIRSNKTTNAMCDALLACNTFAYDTDGLRKCMQWVESLKSRQMCANTGHEWCKIALENYHLCSVCTIKKWAAGGNDKATLFTDNDVLWGNYLQ